jgi:hypothetical protein
MKLVKSPSIAAAEICAKPRTCVVRFPAMVFTDSLVSSELANGYTNERIEQRREGETKAYSRKKVGRYKDVRDLLPDTLHILHLSLDTQLPLRPDFVYDLLDLLGENGELVDHVVNRVDEV